MSSQLKSWFFSTVRGINSRGKYVNFNDGSEPDQVTFSSLMDTTVLKKVGSTYQDQADYVAVNAASNTKFVTADNLPIVENSVDGAITLDITSATTNSEKTKYKINPHFVSDIDQISPDRDTNVFVNPNNLPKVAVEIIGTPIAGQSPLVVGNTITSELNNVDFYETFKLKLNVLTSSFISHSGVLLSTVLNTLRTDVDAKVSDAELAAEVSDLNISIATKANKVTPSIGLNGNGTKVTVNAEGVVTNVNRANASDLKNDSSVAGSTIKDALNNLNSTLSGDLIATVVPNISTETSNFNAVIGTKHFVDTSGGNIICSLPAVIDSASGDLIMVYKSTTDANTITVTDTYMSFVLSQHKDNALFHFSDDRWSFVGLVSAVSQTVTNGVTTKSPSEDAVFDAILAKGIVKSNAWKNNGAGTFTLEPDKYNIVVWSNTNIEILLPALEVEKTIIVQGTTQDGLGAINFTINNIKVGGADLGTPYSVTVTDEKEVLIFYGNYYGWHLIGHANKAIDISTKLDLDGGNANQDIDIDGFGVNAKHFKVNGTHGDGHIGLKHQSAGITASASESSIGADSVGDPVWKNDGGAIDKLELQSNKTGTVTGNEASTSKYLTVKGVYDWAVALFAPKASPTFTGTVSIGALTPNASAILQVDSTTKGSLATPRMTTTQKLAIASPATGLEVFDTTLNVPQYYNGTAWLSILDSSSLYVIPNYYKVNLNTGSDVTGIAGRTDKPYATLQTVWDLIATGNTAEITIEIEGDYTFTTHAINTSVSKNNIIFKFLGKITYAVPATTTSRPLFTFTGTNNNLTFIVPDYSQTTQGGFINTNTCNGHRYLFDNLQILQGVNTTSVRNWGFYAGGGLESYFICNSLTVNITNDASGILGYYHPFQLLNCNYKITTFKITGTPTVASSRYQGFYGVTKSIYIENLITDNGYTNLTYFNLAFVLTCDNVTINNLSIASNGSTQKASNTFTLFNLCPIKNLTINTGSILNYSELYTGATAIQNVHLGNITLNGTIFYASYLETNIHLHGTITRSVASQASLIALGNKGQINGNGNKIIYSDAVFVNFKAIIDVYGSVATPKATFINDLTLYNTSMPVGNVQTFVPIMYYWTFPIKLRLRNVVVSSNVDFGTDPLVNNTHANTSFLRPYAENTSYICRVEGNVATNYLQNVTNLTNNCNVEIITGYIL